MNLACQKTLGQITKEVGRPSPPPVFFKIPTCSRFFLSAPFFYGLSFNQIQWSEKTKCYYYYYVFKTLIIQSSGLFTVQLWSCVCSLQFCSSLTSQITRPSQNQNRSHAIGILGPVSHLSRMGRWSRCGDGTVTFFNCCWDLHFQSHDFFDISIIGGGLGGGGFGQYGGTGTVFVSACVFFYFIPCSQATFWDFVQPCTSVRKRVRERYWCWLTVSTLLNPGGGSSLASKVWRI